MKIQLNDLSKYLKLFRFQGINSIFRISRQKFNNLDPRNYLRKFYYIILVTSL